MDPLERAKDLLSPHMGEDRRDQWLARAFHQAHRAVYDAISQAGATDAFTVACVRTLLDHGCRGGRHALALLLQAVQPSAGDEKQAAFAALIRDLDALCAREPDARCPYRDLRAFQEEDAPYFFGRETFTAELVKAVDRHPFVGVIGPSGCGKSSVARAGLLPVLRRHGTWAIGIIRPGPEPWRSLAACLLDLLQGEPAAEGEYRRLDEIKNLAKALAGPGPDDGATGLRHLVERIVERGERSRLLLLIDQWEEIYTYKETDAATAARFADVLMEASARAPLSVVLTLRADFTGRALGHRPLRDQLQAATVFLGDMNRDELGRAITGPAQRADLAFEAGLVERILDDVGAEPGSLPLLEFCLTQLCARRGGDCMLQAAYDAIGGVRGAIVCHADSVIAAMEKKHPGTADQVRDTFLQLVQLGDGSDDTRRRVALAELGETARPLVTELADARLVVTDRDRGREQDTVEVAHEALIRRWPRLRAWLDEHREDLHARREITRAAAGTWSWPDERVMRETVPVLQRLGSRFPLKEAERRFLGPFELDDMLARLDDPATGHAERARIGDRLALLPGGDPRPGVGLGSDGLPDIDWVAIPAGTVELEVESSGFWRRLRHSHRVFEVKPFHIARYPVTVAQWRPFLDDPDGYDARVRRVRGWEPDPQRGRDNHPVVNVTWVEAMTYCDWLSARLGSVALPTEWEWQQAARGGDPGNTYPWGEWQEGRANTSESELGRATAVGLYPQGRSAQGVLELAGNVWEWCLNKYEDPADVSPGGDARRVVRGGSWDDYRVSARCAFRNHFHPVYRRNFNGFRLVCVSPIR